MSNKRKAQFDAVDQVEAKKQMDKLVRGGMNHIAVSIARAIGDILAELDATTDLPADSEGFKRGLILAKNIAELKITPDVE